MAIQSRELAVGTRLVAKYKGQTYTCAVEERNGKKVYVLEDGREFKSPSAAGSSVMGGQACNGWRFWSVSQGEAAVEGQTQKGEGEANGPTRGRKKKSGNKDRIIRRMDNQEGLSEGQVRWFCVDCMGGFVVEGDQDPEVCPQGHKQEGLVAVEAVPTVESED